jgi:hypothetical protein
MVRGVVADNAPVVAPINRAMPNPFKSVFIKVPSVMMMRTVHRRTVTNGLTASEL